MSVTDPESQTEYELIPSSEVTEQQGSLMGHDQESVKSKKPEGRQGDNAGKYLSLVSIAALTIVTWTAVILSPTRVGWFTFHPTLQTSSLMLFTYGILTLQPTSQPMTKAAGLSRHQRAIFFAAFPIILLGTFAVAYNKWIHNKEHMTTWHGTFGYMAILWIIIQIGLGGGSVWFGGAVFGGGAKAKALWKYHRLSGYLLFYTLLFTIHLGGGQSNWGSRNIPSGLLRFLIYTLAPILVAIGTLIRVRPSKMKFIS